MMPLTFLKTRYWLRWLQALMKHLWLILEPTTITDLSNQQRCFCLKCPWNGSLLIRYLYVHFTGVPLLVQCTSAYGSTFFYLYLWCYVPASAHKILTYESTIISKAPVLDVIQLLHNSRWSTKSISKEIFVYLSERTTREGLLPMVSWAETHSSHKSSNFSVERNRICLLSSGT